jgi:hypothetical protein
MTRFHVQALRDSRKDQRLIFGCDPSCPSLAGDRQSLEVEYGRQKEFCPTDKIEESGVNRSSMK